MSDSHNHHSDHGDHHAAPVGKNAFMDGIAKILNIFDAPATFFHGINTCSIIIMISSIAQLFIQKFY
jgi:hypothetical protein